MATLNTSDIVPQMINGLAVYDLGHGVGQNETVLLAPSPAEDAAAQSARSPLALLLLRLGKRVITFDAPVYRDPATITSGADPSLISPVLATLDGLGVDDEVDVVTWGNMAAQALTLVATHPERVKRLVLIGELPRLLDPDAPAWSEVRVPVLIYLGEAGPSSLARAHMLVDRLPKGQVASCFQDGPNPIDDAPLHCGAVLRTFLNHTAPHPGKVISVEM